MSLALEPIGPAQQRFPVFPFGVQGKLFVANQAVDPGIGNFDFQPVVYRGPYEYSVPGSDVDYIPQTQEG